MAITIDYTDIKELYKGAVQYVDAGHRRVRTYHEWDCEPHHVIRNLYKIEPRINHRVLKRKQEMIYDLNFMAKEKIQKELMKRWKVVKATDEDMPTGTLIERMVAAETSRVFKRELMVIKDYGATSYSHGKEASRNHLCLVAIGISYDILICLLKIDPRVYRKMPILGNVTRKYRPRIIRLERFDERHTR